MAKQWSKTEELQKRHELQKLYVSKNLSIFEIAKILSLSKSAVFDRLKRFSIDSSPELKRGYCNKQREIRIPQKITSKEAEFLGIMYGDGHISTTQVKVTLGSKELPYVSHVMRLIESIFKITPKVYIRKSKLESKRYYEIYFGSVDTVRWLMSLGLTSDKVDGMATIPMILYSDKVLLRAFLRGFFDTDGSVYLLKFGVQISFTSASKLLLESLQRMLKCLQYRPSEISGLRFYLTRRTDIKRFFRSIKPKNSKHVCRYKKFVLHA